MENENVWFIAEPEANKKTIVACDPGLSGSFAVMDGATPFVIDMPVIACGKKHIIDAHEVASFMASFGSDIIVYIERAQAMPRQGVVSVFRYAEGYGMLKGIFAALKIPFVEVAPITWKKALHLSSDKGLSRQKALQLFPTLADQLGRKKDEGRSEALLLGWYGRNVQGNKND
jgi:crossover junction endodeoxyribonuclease RuvC